MKRALESWFAQRGWKPFKFQKDMWRAIANGESGLLHATTGAGKTYAVWLGALMAFGAVAPVKRAQAAINIIANRNPDTAYVAPAVTVVVIACARLFRRTRIGLQGPLGGRCAAAVARARTLVAATPDAFHCRSAHGKSRDLPRAGPAGARRNDAGKP